MGSIENELFAFQNGQFTAQVWQPFDPASLGRGPPRGRRCRPPHDLRLARNVADSGEAPAHPGSRGSQLLQHGRVLLPQGLPPLGGQPGKSVCHVRGSSGRTLDRAFEGPGFKSNLELLFSYFFQKVPDTVSYPRSLVRVLGWVCQGMKLNRINLQHISYCFLKM